MAALETNSSFNALKTRQLTVAEADVALGRARSRIDLYYCHLRDLLASAPHPDRESAIARVDSLRSRDHGWLGRIYQALTRKLRSSDTSPGLALFLHTGKRSFALLPAHEADCGAGAVYMASGWRDVMFNGVLTDDESAKLELGASIRRSNQLWQRERWSVRPIADTAEPHGGTEPVYFNNIGLHLRPTDGWVDAFWGVQSGLRIALPIPNADESYVVLLLSTYAPDVFREWNQATDEYRMPLPRNVASVATRNLRDEFRRELDGLSLVVSLLGDLTRNEGVLLESSMQLLSHYTYDDSSQSPWEGRVVSLVHELGQVAPAMAARVQGLTNLRELSFRRLKAVALRLPATEECSTWRHNLESYIKKGGRADFTPLMLTPPCTVGQLVEAFKALEGSMGSTVTIANSARTGSSRFVRIDPLLLSAVVKNVVDKHGVSVTIATRTTDGGAALWLSVAAFYNDWRLPTEQEDDFLLKPLQRADGAGKRVGFYLTAQVLWRNEGTIEYYRLGEAQGGQTQALIHLGFPLR